MIPLNNYRNLKLTKRRKKNAIQTRRSTEWHVPFTQKLLYYFFLKQKHVIKIVLKKFYTTFTTGKNTWAI